LCNNGAQTIGHLILNCSALNTQAGIEEEQSRETLALCLGLGEFDLTKVNGTKTILIKWYNMGKEI